MPSYPSYKFAKILMSGFQSAPIDAKTLSDKQFINGFINNIEAKIGIKNISFFSDYNFDSDSSNYIYTGATDIFDSTYSYIKFTTRTGYIDVIDAGLSNTSGFLNVSGYVTGIFIDIYVDKISAGTDYSLYLNNRKNYTAYGLNDFNKFGPENLENIKQIQAAKDHSLILFEDGTVTGFGFNNIDGRVSGTIEYTGWNQTPVGRLSGINKISAKNSFNIALFYDGTITGWGNNSFGQTSGTTGEIAHWDQTPLSKLTGVIDIAAGDTFGFVIFNNNYITGWGNDTAGQVSSGLSITNVSTIECGESHTIALLNNKTVTGWGNNSYGQAFGGNNLTGVVAISAGKDYSIALLDNKKVTGWGLDNYGQALSGKNITGAIAISAGRNHNLILLNNKNLTGFGLASAVPFMEYKDISDNIIYENKDFLKSENLQMRGGSISVGAPVGYREKSYAGVFTGIAIFSDYFYNLEDQSVTFTKKTNYSVSATGIFQSSFTVINTVSVNGQVPTINLLDRLLGNKSAFVSEERELLAYGYIQNYPLLRNKVSSFGLISGLASGMGTGIININKYVTGMPSFATANQIVGYKNASGILNYKNPIPGDFIILTNDLTGSNFNFIYETGEDFEVPVYFNSINVLNNIINSGSGDFSITSTISDNRLILKSLIKGKEGNSFRIISQGSTGVPILSGENFTDGITYRNPITPTGIFTALLNTGIYITGYFQETITGELIKDITGLLGYRPFTGLWQLYEILNNRGVSNYINIKETGIVEENSIRTNYTGYSKEQINRRNFSVIYTNAPDFASIDVARLNISLNSGISGYNYNIILTGESLLNTKIIIPSGNTVDIK